MSPVPKPNRPLPVGKDPTRPRPYFDIDTGPLMDQLAEVSKVVQQHQRAAEQAITLRNEIMLELVRRDVSYAAMGRVAGLKTPTVFRIVERNQ